MSDSNQPICQVLPFTNDLDHAEVSARLDRTMEQLSRDMMIIKWMVFVIIQLGIIILLFTPM